MRPDASPARSARVGGPGDAVLETLRAIAGALAADARWVGLDAVQFWHRDTARLAAVALVAAAGVLLAIRAAAGRRPGRQALVVPAVLPRSAGPSLSWVRHLPAALLALGVPFALAALADPYAELVSERVTYPGRRISLMIDASYSMKTSFKAAGLNPRAEVEPVFFTSVSAARRFVELRRQGKYRDLMALIEFGSRAFVITPFTTDYDNLLLSMALISDPVEYSKFPEVGTVIASALEESIEIFRAFDFLEAAGNLMVIFTDGEDTTFSVRGRSLDDILKSAVEHKIPLFFVRTNYGKAFGEGIPDEQWRQAVQKTGGRYYVAKDESSLLAAVADIDRQAVGAIERTEYARQEPRFAGFALVALSAWVAAAGLRLAGPWFSAFP